MPVRLLKGLALACAALLAIWIFTLYRRVPHGKNPYAKPLAAADHVVLQEGVLQIDLQKEKQGWSVAANAKGPFYPVEEERWRTLDSGLRDLNLEDVISERGGQAAEFGLDAAQATRVTALAGAKPLVDGFFGAQAPDGLHIYFRYADQPQVYLAKGLSRAELGTLDFSGWRNHALVNIGENAVTDVTIDIQGRPFEIIKSSDAWSLNGQAVSAEKVNLWLGAFAHLRADDFIDRTSTGAPQGPALNYATLTAKGGAGAPAILRVGAFDAQGKRYPVSAPDGGAAWVSESRMQALLLKPADFQKK